MLLAKGDDITAWRAAVDFTVRYREALLSQTSRCRSDQTMHLLERSGGRIRELAAENSRCVTGLDQICTEIRQGDCVHATRQQAGSGFELLYRHMAVFRSAPAFFRMAESLLQAICAVAGRLASAQLGAQARLLPDMALITLGPGGRREFSPYCPLQLVLLHDGSADGHEALDHYSRLVHEGLEACSLQVDQAITPRFPHWRGSIQDWDERFASGLEFSAPATLIELVRFSDQLLLAGAGQIADRFRERSLDLLHGSHSAHSNLMTRLRGLSNGLSLMGRLKTDRLGGSRNMFALRDHGLIPLSATVSALTLTSGGRASDTPGRIRELLSLRVFDVEMAERLLMAWHIVSGLRLMREHEAQLDASIDPTYLDLEALDEHALEELHTALEAVGVAQRQALMILSAGGE